MQGVVFRDVGTLVGSIRPDGMVMASGQGFLTTKERETVLYKNFAIRVQRKDLPEAWGS